MRLELKYQTHRITAEALFRRLKPIFDIDENSGALLSYENVNIYFDDKDVTSYRQKHEGDNVRTKVRLRYSRPSGAPKFTRCQVEIKERRGVQTMKRSFPVKVKDRGAVLDNVSEYMLQHHGVHLDGFLLPTVGVRYTRTGISSKLIPGVRITFDTDVKAFYGFQDLEHIKPDRLILPSGDCLIEIKASRPVPAVISQLIQTYNFQRVTYSKYAKALEAMHDIFDGRTLPSDNFRIRMRG